MHRRNSGLPQKFTMNANEGNQNSHCLFIYKDPIYQDSKSKTYGFLDELCFYPCLWPQAAGSDLRDYSPDLVLNILEAHLSDRASASMQCATNELFRRASEYGFCSSTSKGTT